MTEKYLYVVNPKSGTGAGRKDAHERLVELLGKDHLEIIETKGKGDVERVLSKIKEIDPALLIIGGGDGTLRNLAPALRSSGIPGAIIPLGSANGLARCLAIEDMDDAFEAISKKKAKKIDLLEINNEICLHLSDFGFNASMIKRYEQESERGMLSYFKSSLAQFLDMKPYRFAITLDGEHFETNARMLVIANGDRYGTGALINPRGKLDDGIMEIVSLNPQGLDDILAISIAMFQGTLHESEAVTIRRAKKAQVINKDGADFQIDGEVMENPGKIDIVCKQGQITFLSRL
ncbi:MAG: diacylglycerol/lipid kinase family protein [Bacteroidota bacterium]